MRFLWSADAVGQGYGINPDIGGMRIYETMRRRKPDLFTHCGDTIYADTPISEQLAALTVTLRGSSVDAHARAAELRLWHADRRLATGRDC